MIRLALALIVYLLWMPATLAQQTNAYCTPPNGAALRSMPSYCNIANVVVAPDPNGCALTLAKPSGISVVAQWVPVDPNDTACQPQRRRRR